MEKLNLAAVKVSAWPVEWRACWLASKAPAASPLDDGGRASGWSPATLRNVEVAVGVCLAWLRTSGDFEPGKLLSDYVDEARIKAFVEAYSPGRAEISVAHRVHGLAYYLRATVAPDGLPWLTKLAHRMMNRATPSRPKLPRMSSVSDLIALGYQLMDAGMEHVSAGEAGGASLFRNGLMIAALAARPTLRMRNFHALRIGHTLFRTHDRYEVRIPRGQTKKGNAIAFRYPDWLTEPFDLYFREIRPKLPAHGLDEDEGWVWIGRNGNHALPPTTVTNIISGVTKQYLGRPTSPHLFRDCATTEVALSAPADVGITKDLLGHKTLASSQAHYNQARSFTALAGLEAALLGLIEDEKGLCN